MYGAFAISTVSTIYIVEVQRGQQIKIIHSVLISDFCAYFIIYNDSTWLLPKQPFSLLNKILILKLV